ncbi:uncharacterized protein C2orf72 isoform X2 [Lepisosteus oculatus]|uniref:uncharacterized protein C2orf72 isoform X2 n=1 Tax=Lepisosteus oculatus TaxID=7918 RepID=UPI000740138B|nr:PREDICTED: uncharacterized protein C2orf72 homolog isoform X2 [Lepisosteus oculatus]
MSARKDFANQDAQQQMEETEFQHILGEIGGRERIFLVSDVCQQGMSSVLEEFLNDMFPSAYKPPMRRCGADSIPDNNSNGTVSNATRNDRAACFRSQKHVPEKDETSLTGRPEGSEFNRMTPGVDSDRTQQGRKARWKIGKACQAKERAIDSPVIIFIFRHEFVSCKANRICLKEILKDVKARSRRADDLPAVLGLIHSRSETAETSESVRILERSMRTVFRKQSPDSVWVGHFIPNKGDGMLEIKRNVCKAVQASPRTGICSLLKKNGHS